MGKLKKGRKNNRKSDPIGSSEHRSKQDSKDENTRTQKIIPLIQKLSSSASNDRSMAISAITVLCEDPRFRRMLLKEKLVSIVMEQCLNDSNDEIVVESFGLLRNLGIEEGYDICVHLWRSNISTTIEACLKKAEHSYKTLDSNSAAVDKSKKQLLFDFTENLISLIVVIASSSDELYHEVFEKLDYILKFVIDLINWNVNDDALKCSSRLFCTLLDFIYKFANESNDFISKLGNLADFNLPKLIQFTQIQNLNNLTKVYVEGIKFHINEATNEYNNIDKQQMVYEILNNLVTTIIKIDIEETEKLLKPIAENNAIVAVEDSAERNQALSDVQSIEITLDIFIAVFEYLSINEEDPDEAVQLNNNLTNLLLDLIYTSLFELKKKKEFESKALVGLNNMSWLFLSCGSIPAEWFAKSNELWDSISSSLLQDSIEIQIDEMGVLWAITKTLGASLSPKLNLQSIESLINRSIEISNSDIDIEAKNDFIVKTVGLLGSIALVISNDELTGKISEYLINLIPVSTKQSQAVVVECLNALYDIFGDKSYEYDYPVFVQQNYLQKLKSLQADVSTMYKLIDKNKNIELKVKAEEAYNNLGRFISYKEHERS